MHWNLSQDLTKNKTNGKVFDTFIWKRMDRTNRPMYWLKYFDVGNSFIFKLYFAFYYSLHRINLKINIISLCYVYLFRILLAKAKMLIKRRNLEDSTQIVGTKCFSQPSWLSMKNSPIQKSSYHWNRNELSQNQKQWKPNPFFLLQSSNFLFSDQNLKKNENFHFKTGIQEFYGSVLSGNLMYFGKLWADIWPSTDVTKNSYIFSSAKPRM